MFAFSYAFSWIAAWIGLSVGSVEAANSAGFIWMFPLTFISSAFVDPSLMVGWLQPIAENNPFIDPHRRLPGPVQRLRPGQRRLDRPRRGPSASPIVFAFIATRKFARSTSA